MAKTKRKRNKAIDDGTYCSHILEGLADSQTEGVSVSHLRVLTASHERTNCPLDV